MSAYLEAHILLTLPVSIFSGNSLCLEASLYMCVIFMGQPFSISGYDFAKERDAGASGVAFVFVQL